MFDVNCNWGKKKRLLIYFQFYLEHCFCSLDRPELACWTMRNPMEANGPQPANIQKQRCVEISRNINLWLMTKAEGT